MQDISHMHKFAPTFRREIIKVTILIEMAKLQLKKQLFRLVQSIRMRKKTLVDVCFKSSIHFSESDYKPAFVFN